VCFIVNARLMVYETTHSVAKILWSRIIELLVNIEFENAWNEAVVI
jgi:hypothetical protein